ncbi:photosynthetic complex assembly protein PuhC [Dichotomicrobium thermohalophilum]|uniref:Putative photosynthetic complex assembly protein n=1 Tax=Dichotomicrobium thermohalophilum TaxID=933063 RepID=A0A397QA89_9HYPH|nr:photosynthetic complex assembly protein PuhC [Dichotomicrobium thermohalophilum]RIA56725.1 putative photosynthetic complex assembly protein [Dichotomicrobium thermohalophilum]
MSENSNHTGVPLAALIGILLLIGFAVGAVFTGQVADVGRVSMPPSAEVDRVSLRFVDRRDGAVEVYKAATDERIAVVEPGTGGFIRGVLRGLVRERKLSGEVTRTPFMLRRWADGRLTLEDPQTGRVIDLGAFGVTNAGAFAKLMVSSQSMQ